MLKNISFKNFKAWENLNLQLGKLTGIFGTNSSGKSSLIQMFLMLKQTKNNADRSIALDFGSQEKLTDLGTYHDVVHKHDSNKDISWQLQWSLAHELKIKDVEKSATSVLFKGKELSLSSTIGFKGRLLEIKQLSYGFDGIDFSIDKKAGSSSEMELKAQGNTPDKSYRFIRTQGRNWKLPQPVKNYLFPDQAKTYYKNADFLSQFEAEFESAMDNIYYLGPLREPPKRNYQWSGTSPTDVGMRGELTVNAILAATSKGVKRNLGKGARYKTFEAMIAHWLRALGLISSFRVEELAPNSNQYKTLVQKEAGATEVGLTDVGFGVSQILPVIVLLYYVPEGSTVLFEQPEMHLHPAVQSQLADLILTVSNTRNIQVIVESHSEHFIRRLQRRVAEDHSKNEDLKLYFFSTDKGQSRYEALQLDEFGAIHNWPENFFGNEMAEISATRKAALLKRKKQMAQDK
jgi:predicted ATPase